MHSSTTFLCRSFASAVAIHLLVFVILAHPARAAPDCLNGIPDVATTVATPRSDQPWIARVETQQQQVRQQPADLYLIGDSLAGGWQATSLSVNLRRRVVNLGIGGDKTENVIWRLKAMVLPDEPPPIFLVIVGTNNLSGSPACDIFYGIHRIVSLLNQKAPEAKVVVATIFPRGHNFSELAEKIETVNVNIHRYASNWGALVFDENDDLRCEIRGDCNFYYSDMIHFNEAGYGYLTKQLSALLDSLPDHPKR